jgi:hypothetical protein
MGVGESGLEWIVLNSFIGLDTLYIEVVNVGRGSDHSSVGNLVVF